MSMRNSSSSPPCSVRGLTSISRRIPRFLPAILALTVSSCGTTPTRAPLQLSPDASGPLQPVQKIDPSLLAPCPALPLASSGKSDALLRNHLQITTLYHDCQARQASLSIAVRKHAQQETERLLQVPASSATPVQH